MTVQDVLRDFPVVAEIGQIGAKDFALLRDVAERELGKPVLAINVATLWHALRACGVDDRIEGFGRILEEA